VVELQRVARGGSELARKLSYLAGQLASSDFKPTNQQLEVQKLLEELAMYEGQYDMLRPREWPLNELLGQQNVSHHDGGCAVNARVLPPQCTDRRPLAPGMDMTERRRII
jgi:hypothetical protein